MSYNVNRKAKWQAQARLHRRLWLYWQPGLPRRRRFAYWWRLNGGMWREVLGPHAERAGRAGR